MKILVDALASTAHAGGMRLHARELLRAWHEEFPQDEVILACGRETMHDFAGLPFEIHVYANEGFSARALCQFIGVPLLQRRTSPDFTLALGPLLSPLIPRSNTAIVVHDWRHLGRPSEFGRMQRAYRALWRLATRRAQVVFCVSKKTLRETQALEPASSTVLVEHGWDHARRWEHAQNDPEHAGFITFGHHSNKRADLAIKALPLLSPGARAEGLTVLGARGPEAARLRTLAEECGVSEYVTLPGFVSDLEYQRYLRQSRVVLLLSSDEGFGLPVVEAAYFGIPVVVCADSGLLEIFGDRVESAEPREDDVARAMQRALESPHTGWAEVRRSWRDAAHEMRDALDRKAMP